MKKCNLGSREQFEESKRLLGGININAILTAAANNTAFTMSVLDLSLCDNPNEVTGLHADDKHWFEITQDFGNAVTQAWEAK